MRSSEEYLAGQETSQPSQSLSNISHLIGSLASVVQTFLVGSSEEQHAGTTLL